VLVQYLGDRVQGPELAAHLGELDLELLALAPVQKRGLLDPVDAVLAAVLGGLEAEIVNVLMEPDGNLSAARERAFADEL
jgi:hypothetical protein